VVYCWENIVKVLNRSTFAAAVLALGAAGLSATAALAATITTTSATISSSDINTSFQVNYVCSATGSCNGGTPDTTLRARTNYTLVNYAEANGKGYWLIDLVIRNTSALAAGGFLSAAGFSTDPDAAVDSFLNPNVILANWGVQGGTNQFPGFPTTEVCVFAGTSCADTSNAAMTSGKLDRVQFWLETDLSLSDSLTFTGFTARWAGVGQDNNGYGARGRIKVAPVPLPAAGGMLLVALFGLAAMRRARKTA
jgi:hypothetical protein